MNTPDLEVPESDRTADPATLANYLNDLSMRVSTLQTQSDELRGENVILRRSGIHQIYSAQIDALRTDVRDLISLATRRGLSPHVVRLISSNGMCAQFETPASYEQTLPLDGLTSDAFASLRPVHLACAHALDSVIVVTSKFRLLRATGMGIQTAASSDWRAARAVVALRRGEQADCILSVDEAHAPRYVVVVTRMGWVRALSWSAFEQIMHSGQPFASKTDGDTPVRIIGGEGGDVLVVSRAGKWTRFPLGSVEPAGSQAINVTLEDDVVDAVLVDDQPAIFFVGPDGAMLGVSPTALATHKRPLAKPGGLPRGFRVMACLGCKPAATILTLGYDLTFDVVGTKRLRVGDRISDSQPLNVISRKLAAVALLQ